MKVGIILFPGSNRERDAAWITQHVLGLPTRIIFHTETDLQGCDVLILPGGFSYGDYLRCGAIARFAPVMALVADHARHGGLVLGICNGFQILTEAGLLPGALVRNQGLKFICRWVDLKVEHTHQPWTRLYTPGEVIRLPIAHGEGNYFADPDLLQELEDRRQIVFRYVDPNPNGSLHNIAGVANAQGNVLGLMPHPENASDPALGFTDGLRLFKSLLVGVPTR